MSVYKSRTFTNEQSKKRIEPLLTKCNKLTMKRVQDTIFGITQIGNDIISCRNC